MRNRNYSIIIAIGWLLCASMPSIADDASKPFDEYKIKAVFIYNFTKFVSWPGEHDLAQTHTANICILGDDPFGARLDMLKQASSAQLTFHIKRDITESQLSTCQIVFISKSESAEAASIIAAARSAPVLTVSDEEGFAAKGGIVEMTKTENNIGKESIKLIINLRSAESAGLRIDAQLLGIAEQVIK